MIRIETLGLDILKCVGFYPDISNPSNPDGVSNNKVQAKKTSFFKTFSYHFTLATTTILYEAELFSGAIGYITNMAPSFSSSLVKVRDGSGPFFCPRVGDMGFEISLGSSRDSMTFGSHQAQVNKILFGF